MTLSTALRPGILAILLVALPAAAAERRALVIGIDDYSASTLQPPPAATAAAPQPPGRSVWRDLYGAVNDAEAMREMLISPYGFDAGNVELLTDQEATRAAMLEALDRLAAAAGKGDHVVFYFAGHGSRVVNSKSDEPDGRDETLVPADSRLGARDVRDKELRRRFNAILDRGARLTIILDSCYSGSGARGLPRQMRPRGLEVDPRDVADGADYGPRPEDRGALVFAAAQDDQLAWETFDEELEDHGAFSLALLRAMRAAGAHEPAEHLFLRARAQLQVAPAPQYPVLAGSQAVRRAALFGGRVDHRGGQTVVAVRYVDAGGTVVLQGGWANGLTVGSKLRLRDRGAVIELEVTTVEGLSRSSARVVGAPRLAATPSLKAGDLVELSGWAAPPGRQLLVWIPQAGESARQLAKDLEAGAAAAGVGWVVDPVAESPTHVLSRCRDSWCLQPRDAEPEDLGAAPAASAILSRLRNPQSRVRLFVHLPAPAELLGRLVIGAGTDHDAVERTRDPRRADYFLVGRLRGGRAEYAWVRPLAGPEDRQHSSLPLRTDWYPSRDLEPAELGPASAAGELEGAVLQLAKLRAWLALEAPPGNDFPYQLALRTQEGELVTGGQLAAGRRLGLAVRAREPRPATPVVPRYAYVFVIDSHGESTLLFPPAVQGSVENRIPGAAGGGAPPPRTIAFGAQPLFEVSPPFGVDTYFLLTSAEPIPNPGVLEYPGVRTRGPEGQTALEELLSLTGATTRSADPLVTPVTWSVERLVVESVEETR